MRFKILKPGPRKDRNLSGAIEKRQQVHEYARHQKWAVACGLNDDAFQSACTKAHTLKQIKRGIHDLPTWMHIPKATQRQHAILLCRVNGLRLAARIAGATVEGEICTGGTMSFLRSIRK